VQTVSSEATGKTYVITWLALVCLTAATVGVFFLHLGNAGGIIALTIASVKAGLILLFFMNLRQEGRLIQAIFLIPVVLIGIIVAFTFLDVFLR